MLHDILTCPATFGLLAIVVPALCVLAMAVMPDRKAARRRTSKAR